jgi:hypothetical protein
MRFSAADSSSSWRDLSPTSNPQYLCTATTAALPSSCGAVHRFHNASDELARLILTFTPAGIERFFQQTFRRAYDPNVIPDNVAEIAACYAAVRSCYGVTLLCAHLAARDACELGPRTARVAQRQAAGPAPTLWWAGRVDYHDPAEGHARLKQGVDGVDDGTGAWTRGTPALDTAEPAQASRPVRPTTPVGSAADTRREA